MDNRRRFLRFDVRDFLEIRPLNEPAKVSGAHTVNLSLMGICFFSQVEWKVGQVLYIDYFIPDELDSVKIKAVVVWSEFIDHDRGYLNGVELIDVEPDKEDKFIRYYFQQLKKKFF